MITNRSSEPRLLRSRGGKTTEKLPEGPSSPLLAKGNKSDMRAPDKTTMTQMVKKGSGSQTHKGGLGAEPSMRDLGATKKQTRDALPRSGAGFGIAKRAAGGSTPKRSLGGFLKGANDVGRYAMNTIVPKIPVVGQVMGGVMGVKNALQKAAGYNPQAEEERVFGKKRGGIARGKPGASTGGTAQESYVNHGARPDGKVESRDPIQSAKGGKWIQGAIKHPGKLHRELGVPQGKKIPAAKMAKAEHSRNPTIRKEANLAHTLSGLRRGR